MPKEMILSAARVLRPRGAWLEPGAVHLRDGRIESVGDPRELRRRQPRAESLELPGFALLPGLVNAHAHLELSGLEGATPRGPDFASWVRAVVQQRGGQSAQELEAAALAGARRCLAGGTTTIGDFDASGAAERAFGRSPGWLLRVVLFRELLDARDPQRTRAALARVTAARSSSDGLRPGLAPHGPHTVSKPLLEAIALATRAEGLPFATHWAETAEECAWLEEGSGPFAALLGESPRRSGLELLADAGALGPRTALVHGNLAREHEIARIAASGATLVHCPGSHAFFERAPFDLRAWHAAGVPVALGTDSLASNGSLDLRRELALLLAAHPWLEPRDAWDCVTVHAARAIGLRGRVGELTPGALADVLAVAVSESDDQRCLRRLAHGDFDVAQVWVGGVAMPVPQDPRDCAAGAMGCAPGGGGPG